MPRPNLCGPFIERALTLETDDCIEWPFKRQKDGYPHIKIRGEGTKLAHRIVCERAHGKPGFHPNHAAHSCHNPPCINPRHLRWATPRQNSADIRESGRWKSIVGEGHPSSKLTKAQVLAIFASKGPARIQAKKYGVSRETISSIRRGINWSWLTKKEAS